MKSAITNPHSANRLLIARLLFSSSLGFSTPTRFFLLRPHFCLRLGFHLWSSAFCSRCGHGATAFPALTLGQLRGLGGRLFLTLRFPGRDSFIVREQNRDMAKVSLLAIGAPLGSGPDTPSILSGTAVDERR